jgi:hypothetical protein
MNELVPYNPISFSKEDISTIENLAAVNYSPTKIALFLRVNKRAFLLEYNNPDSLVREAFDRGQLESKFEIDNAMLEKAKKGNITAVQIYDKHRDINDLEILKNKYIYGDET